MFDRLLAYRGTKQSIHMSESKRPTRKDDPVDVGAVSKGSGKGQSEGKGKKEKDQNHISNVSAGTAARLGTCGGLETKAKAKAKAKAS